MIELHDGLISIESNIELKTLSDYISKNYRGISFQFVKEEKGKKYYRFPDSFKNTMVYHVRDANCSIRIEKNKDKIDALHKAAYSLGMKY